LSLFLDEYRTPIHVADAAHALNITTSANTIALLHGASILRVHDVKEAAETVALYRAMKEA
jgi:dihydropteroate synthase